MQNAKDKDLGAIASSLLLLLMLVVAPLLPRQVTAQLSPVTGDVLVGITSPNSGARVGGAVTVSASVSSASSGNVSAVRFKINGGDLGAPDTTPPYSASWDASAATDGWHTLTAVARDSSGLEFSSDPVTVRVSNTAPTPMAAERLEETDPSVTYSAGWIIPRNTNDWHAWSGGGAVQSATPGATATFSFFGTSATWIGYRSLDSGIARVLVDGVFLEEVDLFARREESSSRVYTVTGLTNSSHELTIEVTGRKNAESSFSNIVVDAFDVPAPMVSHLQETDPFVSYTTGWFSGDVSKPWSGGTATVSTAPGAQATLTFEGTAVRWIGYRGPDTGIARVYLDGSFAGEIDTYSPRLLIQDTLFTATDLADRVSHTLTIEATGLRNADSTDNWILVDAFDVTTLGTRFQETDWSVTYTGGWTHGNLNRPWSEGTAAGSNVEGARATFSFSGTSVSWIGFHSERTGIARVYLDGEFVTLVDTYTPTEGFQNTLFSASGLDDERHTLTIEATGGKNAASANNYVIVDAFDVRR